MTDAILANIARQLAEALQARAHSRSIDDTKRVAELHTVLCKAVRDEAGETSILNGATTI